jgi:hypothetical protein
LPYLCRVTIAGPAADDGGVALLIEAVSDAVQNGWDAPRVSAGNDETDFGDDDESSDGAILDYRVLGYPGGAIVLVVLDCDDFMQSAVAVAALTQHLTTWSPGLLEFAPQSVEITRLDKPFDEDNWLPPLTDEERDSGPRWPLSELLDENLQELAGKYLLATALRAVWHPAAQVFGDRADDVVAGSVRHPWGKVLSHELGVLLISAARFEGRHGSRAKLIVHGSGDLALADDLLRRARAAGHDDEDDGLTDDAMRGHVLVEDFIAAHDLQWNRVPDDDPPEGLDARSNRQLKTLLWAGIRAAATLCAPLAALTGPWQVLNQLDDDVIVALYAEQEHERNEAAAENDAVEVHLAGASHLLVWLAIRHPDLLETWAADGLIRDLSEDVSTLHQVIYATIVMAGPEPLKAALAQHRTPKRIRRHMDAYAAALAETERNGHDENADLYDDMHGALELALADGPGLRKRIRFLLAITGTAARISESDPASDPSDDAWASSPRTITHYLLVEPALHSAADLRRHDDDAAIRTTMLCQAARVSPVAVADLIAEFPEIGGDDPRLEPAARTRATRWVEKALHIAEQHGDPAGLPDHPIGHADAQTVINAITESLELPPDWAVHRVVSAAAYAAAAILHAIDVGDRAREIFADD